MAKPNRRENLRGQSNGYRPFLWHQQKSAEGSYLGRFEVGRHRLGHGTEHKRRLLAEYPGEMRFKPLHVLDIPDNYRFMDTELIDEIRTAVEPILAEDIR